MKKIVLCDMELKSCGSKDIADSVKSESIDIDSFVVSNIDKNNNDDIVKKG